MKVFFVLIFVIIQPFIFFASQDRSITELEIAIKREKQLFEKEKKEYEGTIIKLNKGQKQRQELLEKEKESLDKIINLVREEERKISYLKSLIQNNDTALEDLRNGLIKKINETIEIVNSGIPYQIERRIDTLIVLKKDIFENIISEDEALNRFLLIVESENDLTSTSETWITEIKIDNQKIKSKCIRIGLITMAAVEEESDGVYIIKKENNNFKWQRLKKYSERVAVRNAVKMIEGKKIPNFIDFPIDNSLIAKCP